jgi:hypothetical protein
VNFFPLFGETFRHLCGDAFQRDFPSHMRGVYHVATCQPFVRRPQFSSTSAREACRTYCKGARLRADIRARLSSRALGREFFVTEIAELNVHRSPVYQRCQCVRISGDVESGAQSTSARILT